MNTLLKYHVLKVLGDDAANSKALHYRYSNKTDVKRRQCTYNVTLNRVRQSLLLWKSNKCYICVCAGARVRACSLAYQACKSYAPHCDVICGPSGSTIFFDIIS
jgi:hypothetical protein